MGVYVLLGSAQHSLLDNKKFYRPVLTPYELHLALTPGAEWSGDYVLDYARLLPMLARGAAEFRADGADSDGDEPPVLSLLSGKLLRSAPVSEEADGPTETDGAAGGALGLAGGGRLATTGQYALAQSGAEFLARRTYSGLEPRYGEHAPALVQEGRSGIASGFQGEPAMRAPQSEEAVAQPRARPPREPAAGGTTAAGHAAAVGAAACAATGLGASICVRALSGDRVSIRLRVA